MKEKINVPFIFFVLSIIGLVIAVTTGNETIRTLLGAPSFVGFLIFLGLCDSFSFKVKDF